MKHLASIGIVFLTAWLLGCAGTVSASAGDAAPVDVRSDATDGPSDASDAGLTVVRGTVAMGSSHACALDERGAVWCWGSNDYGQLGDGTTNSHPTPVRAVGIEGAVQVAVGHVSSCAVLRDGTVRCWGMTLTRSIEPGPRIPRDALTLMPQAVANLDRVQSVAVQSGTGVEGGLACAVRDDGSVWCWGNTARVPGYLEVRTAAPTGPSTLTGITALGFESFYKCARARVGTVTCWDLRPWDPTFPRAPVMLDGVTDALDLAGGQEHLCVLSRTGTVRCMGDNRFGELGDGSDQPSLRAFVTVRGLSDAVAISSGGSVTTVALRSDGTVVQWGSGDSRLRALAAVAGLHDIIDVSMSFASACARRTDGAVLCWGLNGDGQLGDGTLRGHADARPVVGLGR